MKCKQCEMILPRKATRKIHMWYFHRNSLYKGIKLRLPWHEEEKDAVS